MSVAPTDFKGVGLLAPVIDRNRCEGKEDCARVCPYDVFELGVLSRDERAQLSFVGKLKAFAHGGRQAFAVRADACHGCGLCVDACPEKAIRLAGGGSPRKYVLAPRGDSARFSDQTARAAGAVSGSILRHLSR
jgi:4Fe-4S ferredoxin